jgi:ubiquinone/menaquinone biosynthesis C-methylase UbiE
MHYNGIAAPSANRVVEERCTVKRVRIAEVMDDPCLDPGAHRHALDSLARANRLFGVNQSVCKAVRGAVPCATSLLDLGCGSGALLLQLVESGTSPRVLGMDRSEFALRLAARKVPRGSWIVADVRQLPLAAASIDVVVCTLLLHHFDPHDAGAVLAEAARVARSAVLISDLTRSSLAWAVTWATTRVLSRSWVFHTDGPRSVRAAYTPAEMQSLARQAGMDCATISRQFPFRMLLVWHKQNADLQPVLAFAVSHHAI